MPYRTAALAKMETSRLNASCILDKTRFIGCERRKAKCERGSKVLR